jgi:hypothetical protein
MGYSSAGVQTVPRPQGLASQAPPGLGGLWPSVHRRAECPCRGGMGEGSLNALAQSPHCPCLSLVSGRHKLTRFLGTPEEQQELFGREL